MVSVSVFGQLKRAASGKLCLHNPEGVFEIQPGRRPGITAAPGQYVHIGGVLHACPRGKYIEPTTCQVIPAGEQPVINHLATILHVSLSQPEPKNR